MTRRMLINAIHPEECRVAIADDDRLLELDVEWAGQVQLRGNIYKASITRVEPSLQAAFLDIGSTRNGFLQINDIHPSYFNNWPPENTNGRIPRPMIQDVLRGGQELVVQVVKDERDAKGATLTTNLSMPGRYLVLMVGSQRGGVSRKINDESQRYRLKQAVQKLKIPAGMGVIVRTAGINKTSEELQSDLDGLLELWYEIVAKSSEPGAPKILYQESDLAIRSIRDYLTSDIDEIIIDESATYERARDFVQKIMPSFLPKVHFHDTHQPLLSKFHLDRQVEATNLPEVTLPSGGSVVISQTEAVVTIDVNSGRSTGQSDVEETAFNTNKEAAELIAQQLRLRDLGGLVVIDFIDMNDKRHKAIVEKTLKDAARGDKAKIEISRISKFGLLEMSRQRMKASLVSQSHSLCPHCSGRGRVKTAEAAALEALRKIQSALCAGGVIGARLRMAPAAALFLLNTKRQAISKLENDTGVSIFVYADGRMRPEDYELELDTGKHDSILPEEPREHIPRERDNRDRYQSSSNNRDRGGDNRQRSGGGQYRQGSGRAQQSSGRDDRPDRGGRGRGRGRNNNRRRGSGPNRPYDNSERGPRAQTSERNTVSETSQPINETGSGGNMERERRETPPMENRSVIPPIEE